MKNSSIHLTNSQLLETLSQFPPDGLKKLIDRLFRKNLYSPPALSEITRVASRTVNREKLGPDTAADAVRWARSQK